MFYLLEDFVASTRCWHSVLDSTVKRQEYFRGSGEGLLPRVTLAYMKELLVSSAILVYSLCC